ncbi:citramalate synthase [Kaistia algarum]|uniref:citramalate synthase n=1 Tax=Kaistia algarum TaxID=2083279 RepID=UPI000CE8A9AF|nr:citramalate synthase [Kaistia algarum]MCX5515005.1 citramalate synthase [Kaistia algarum]PPE79747.1 citramalate synthase [Kaistia algarum]
MTRERITLFDTTLRDGAQTNGVDFSVEDKVLIAGLLDGLGIDYVEGGYPGANPTDNRFFSEKRTQKAQFTAFGMTKRAGVSLSNDPGVAALLASKSDAICFVAKTSAHQVRFALGASLEDNLDGIRQSVAAAIASGKEALVDCEHFFDGYKSDPDYALACAKAAHAAGARWVVLCDTNGGSQPEEIEAIVRAVTAHVPGSHLGVHAHNDTEQAVANSLAAVRGGVRQIQGTLNGIGERCGNANLVSIIPTLLLKPFYAERYEIGVSLEALKGLTALSHRFDEIVNRAPNRQAPYVGASAFATKAGIHASAIVKDPSSYEHVPPESVGNTRRVLVSDQAGRSNLLAELSRLGIAVEKSDARLDTLLNAVKEREAIGYSYEGADASFELLARRTLGNVPDYFTVESFHVTVERRFDATGRQRQFSESEAVVKLVVGGQRLLTVGEGNGPVNALDRALRKDLGVYQDVIADLELIDYKVRILNGGTEAVTRVLIESRDGSGDSWSTVGVSENVVDASFEALIDSIVYKLVRAGVQPA